MISKTETEIADSTLLGVTRLSALLGLMCLHTLCNILFSCTESYLTDSRASWFESTICVTFLCGSHVLDTFSSYFRVSYIPRIVCSSSLSASSLEESTNVSCFDGKFSAFISVCGVTLILDLDFAACTAISLTLTSDFTSDTRFGVSSVILDCFAYGNAIHWTLEHCTLVVLDVNISTINLYDLTPDTRTTFSGVSEVNGITDLCLFDLFNRFSSR